MVVTHFTAPGEAVMAALVKAFEEAHEKARAHGHELIASVPLPAWGPCDLQALVTADLRVSRGYWLSPQGDERCAVGVARELIGEGIDAVAQVATQWTDAVKRAHEVAGSHLVAYGGFAFSPEGPRDALWQGWPGGVLVIPQLYVRKSGSQTMEVIAQQVVTAQSDPAQLAATMAKLYAHCVSLAKERVATPVAKTQQEPAPLPVDDEAYERAVRDTAADIRAGQYEKVVLARRVDYAYDARPALAHALSTLRGAFSDSTLFLWARGETVFLGATPERLVSVKGGAVVIDCLAGTAVRSDDPETDEQNRVALLASAKNRAEHQAVVAGVLAATTSFATAVSCPSAPQILRLVHVQHLHTPVTGKLREGSTVLAAVQALHPTPAVAGLPRRAAQAVIQAREPLDRGYYAGPFGFVDSAGEGAFVVALRSALVRPERLSLFAGGGIMGDSDPLSEWAETEWKLRPMRTAFGLRHTTEERKAHS